MSEAPSSAPPAPPPSAPQAALSKENIRALWTKWTRQIFAMREGQFFLLLAVVIGIFSGLSVVLFRIAIDWVRIVLLGSSLAPPWFRVVTVPAVAGIFVALLVVYAFPASRGSGVNQTKAAVYIYDGYIPFQTVIGKFVTCALAIGSGQSLGPEDPSLQMGAGIASAMGRRLQLSQEKVRLIAPVGAAAGLAAAFNAPISSVLFVIEEVLGTWSAGALGAIVLAAVSSVVTMRWFLGSDSLFRVPPFRMQHPAELLAYGALGVVGGGVSLVFLKWIAWARPRLETLPPWTRFVKPAAAGLIVGFVGIWVPQVMGAGYPVIDQGIHGEFAWKILLLLALLKVVVTGISFLSGAPGGMFAPTLFIGAMLGGAVGAVEQHFFHRLAAAPGAFALVGMGTLFAGFLRIPITSVFMVIEVSGNYTAVLPVMISTMIAYLVSRQYHKTSLFDMLARQDGVVLPSIEELREQGFLTVEDAMRRNSAVVVDPGEAVAEVVRRAAAKPDGLLLLRARGNEWRLLSREELTRIAADSSKIATTAQAHTQGPLPVLFRDQSLEEALRLAGDWPILPVVSRANLGQLEGVIAVSDILHAFRNAPQSGVIPTIS
jgi:chloride channel protein, CIC family